jgi:large subunit ribosomal protein L20
MARVKRGTIALKRRRSVLKRAKGYNFGRSKKERQAKEALFHSGRYSFAHRRDKKNDFRQLWNVRINAALREHGTTYSKFIGALKKKRIGLDRKVLATIAQKYPETFERIVKQTV